MIRAPRGDSLVRIGQRWAGLEVLDHLWSCTWLCQCRCGCLYVRSSAGLRSALRPQCPCNLTWQPGAVVAGYCVLEPAPRRHVNRPRWKIQCLACRRVRDTDERALGLLRNLGTANTCCRRRGARNHRWAGYRGISGRLWRQIQNSQRRLGPPTLTLPYVARLFDKQGGRCALSGLQLEGGANLGGAAISASLDRVDNTRGYVKGNVQWVHRTINMMKRDLPQDVFLLFCRAVTNQDVQADDIPIHKSIGHAKT